MHNVIISTINIRNKNIENKTTSLDYFEIKSKTKCQKIKPNLETLGPEASEMGINPLGACNLPMVNYAFVS